MEVITYIGDVESFLVKDNKNKVHKTTSRQNATIFANNEADKFIQNSVPKNMRNKLLIRTIKNKNLFLQGIDDIDDSITNNNVIKNSSNTINTDNDLDSEFKSKDIKTILDELNSTPENIDVDKLEKEWLSFLESSDEFIKSIKEYRVEFVDELRLVEDQILDIRHSIEFDKFGVVQAYKMLMYFKHKLKYRRKLKNAMDLTSVICRDWFSKLETNNIYKSVENRKTKRYTARALPELFND